MTQSKPRRPKPETPKGFRDYFGSEVTDRKAMLDRVSAVYERRGFDALETSGVETVEALGKFLPDVDRPNAGVFAWREEDLPGIPGDWLALRYDLTAPLARVAAQYRNDLAMPYRRYAVGPVWRNENTGAGRFKQFYQCDADTVGSSSPAADAEILMMLTEALEAAGIERGDYVVKLNDRRVLNGVLEVSGIPDDMADEVLRTIDKFDKVGVSGVRELLTDGRLDASGTRIDGVGLSLSQAEAIISFLTAKGSDNDETLARLSSFVGETQSGREGLDGLRVITNLLSALGITQDRVVIDPSVVRGLGYYTGPVFEADLTFEVLDRKGRKRQFGSVAGGGRYDGLVERFTGQKMPAVGVSIGVDRLLAALREKGKIVDKEEGPVLVTVMDKTRMADYLMMAAELQAAGIRAEVYLGNPNNFGAQLKYADKRKSPVALIQGSKELEKGVVIVKDLVMGAEMATKLSFEEWREQPAQVEVNRDEITSRVRTILDRG